MAKGLTKKQLEKLKSDFGKVPDAQLAKELGISGSTLLSQAKSLGLHATERDEVGAEHSNATLPGGEKMVKIDNEEVEMVPSGFMVKTEDGWKPIMIRKAKIST